MIIQETARLCHEANRAICQCFGDPSQKSWEDAEQWQRDSAIRGVEFALANPEASPEDQHEAWCRDKREAGWTYGETKDADKKTHPCLIAYALLPVTQRAKDHVFRAIVHTIHT